MTSNPNNYNRYNGNNSDEESNSSNSNDLSSKLSNNSFKFDTSNQQYLQQQFSNYEKHDNFFNNQQQQQYRNNQQQQHNQNHPHHPQHQPPHYNNYNPYRYNSNNNNNNNNNYNNNNYNNNYQRESLYIKKQNEIVKSHYDHKQNIPIHIRSKSKIISLKNLNNWVKSVLIQEYSKPNTIVFDICGGKLGDLQKWIKAQIRSLVVADISLESLKHGVERYNQALHFIHFDIKMIAVDCFSQKLLESFPKQPSTQQSKQKQKKPTNDQDDDSESDISDNEDYDDYDNGGGNGLLKVDLVSCQFALHYSFRSKESAIQLLKNVSSVLKEGGHFIGTIPNACLIVKKLRESKSNKFGNEVYSIEFKDKDPSFTAFGCEYKFYLEDAIDFLEEYLVHMDVLVELAKEFQLELVSESNFHEFIYEKSKSHYDLLRKMHCFNQNHTVSQAEWDALGIYKVFVFKKVSNNNSNNNSNINNQNQQQQQDKFKPHRISEEDIIVHL